MSKSVSFNHVLEVSRPEVIRNSKGFDVERYNPYFKEEYNTNRELSNAVGMKAFAYAELDTIELEEYRLNSEQLKKYKLPKSTTLEIEVKLLKEVMINREARRAFMLQCEVDRDKLRTTCTSSIHSPKCKAQVKLCSCGRYICFDCKDSHERTSADHEQIVKYSCASGCHNPKYQSEVRLCICGRHICTRCKNIHELLSPLHKK